MSYMKGLYHRTNNCITEATNLMNYHLKASLDDNEHTESETFLFKWIDKFERYFNPKDRNWRRVSESSMLAPQEKLRQLLKYVRPTNGQGFTYLVRNMKASTVAEKLRIVDSVYKILDECSETRLSDMDRLCYTRLSLVKLISHLFPGKGDIIDAATFRALEEKVIESSAQLVKAEIDHPEPYLFYILMTWPFLEERVRIFEQVNI